MLKSRYSLFVLFLILVLGSISVAEASLYLHNGKYSFTVNVRNRYFKDISRASGYVQVSGNYARLDVSAQGYRRGYSTVYLNPNQTNYYVNVSLDDPMSSSYVVDDRGRYVEGAYTDSFSQSMYWGDEFGIRARLPIKGFENLKQYRIEVRVNHMFAFAPRIYLSKLGNNWEIEAVVKRQDMNEFSNTIHIVTPRDPEPVPPPASGTSVLALAKDYVQNAKLAESAKKEEIEILQNRLSSLACQMQERFGALDEGERKSVISALGTNKKLIKELEALDKFEKLQK